MNNRKYIQVGQEYDYVLYLAKKHKEGTLAILLQGPPGTGKTLMCENLAKDLDTKCFVIDGSPDTDRRDFEGQMEIKEGDTSFIDGALTESIRYANKTGIAVLRVDEINAVRESEQIAFNPVIAEGGISLMSNAGERVELESGKKLILIGTMNPGITGTVQLQPAFKNRFTTIIEVDYPTFKREVEIIKEMSGTTDEIAKIVAETGRQLRDACVKDWSLESPFSTRSMVNFCDVINDIPLKFLDYAIETSIINLICSDDSHHQTVNSLMSGQDFKAKLEKAIKNSRGEVKPEVIVEVKPEVEMSENAIIDMKNLVFNYITGKGGDTNLVMYNTKGELKWGPLDIFWKSYNNITTEYFKLSTDIFEAMYDLEQKKSPYKNGKITRTYIIWLYRHKKELLKNFMTKVAPVL
jgi:Mg-chelatase subunit ChlI